MKKTISSLLMIPAFALGLGSCRDFSKDFCKQRNYNGYSVMAGFNENGKFVRISDGSHYIFAKGDTSKSYFTQINMCSEISSDKSAIDSEEEKVSEYSSQDSLKKVYQEVTAKGCDCGSRTK